MTASPDVTPAKPTFLEAAAVYLKPRVLIVLFLGFSSGLPLALSGSTLLFWAAEVGVNLKTIGLFALVEALDAERVDHDILRCGRRSDHQRAERDNPGRGRRIVDAEEQSRGAQQQLRQDQPGAPPPEPAREDRHVERVADRRPQNLERVRRADQR